MKIKIIDLLIKIAKEGAPQKIMYDSDIWKFDDDKQDYSDEAKYLFADYMSDFAYKPEFLNDEVEIIEEEKEIEKINYEEHIGIDLSEAVCSKVNEIIDVVNELKKEK